MDNDLVDAVRLALDFAAPELCGGDDKVAAQDFIVDLRIQGYKIVKEAE